MGKKRDSKATSVKTIYDLQAEICAALAHPVRLHILDLVAPAEKTSTELLEVLQVPKANLSQHLAVLKDAGIIETRREGQFQFHRLAFSRIKDACALVRSLLVERISLQEKKNSELMRELRAQR